MSADTAPAAMPGEEDVARALCAYTIRVRRKWDTSPDEVEAMIAKGDVINLAWRDFVGEAEVVHALFAPILAEKEREIGQAKSAALLQGANIDVMNAALDTAKGFVRQVKAAEARALAAEAALAAERERCAKIAEQFAEAHAQFPALPHAGRAIAAAIRG